MVAELCFLVGWTCCGLFSSSGLSELHLVEPPCSCAEQKAGASAMLQDLQCFPHGRPFTGAVGASDVGL